MAISDTVYAQICIIHIAFDMKSVVFRSETGYANPSDDTANGRSVEKRRSRSQVCVVDFRTASTFT